MPATNRRNFVAGATAAAATAPFLGREAEAAPSDIGQWSSVLWWPCVAIHMIQLGDNILTIQDDDAVFPARGANFSKAFVVHIGEATNLGRRRSTFPTGPPTSSVPATRSCPAIPLRS